MKSTSEEMLAWLETRPEIEHLRAAVCDLNGLMRGKLIPVGEAKKALSGGLRIPLSATSVDIWGNDIADSKLVYEAGDGDGILEWTGRRILPMEWLRQPGALIPLWLCDESGIPFSADPRRALAAVLERYAALGLKPVVATELEFYLLDALKTRPTTPTSPATGKPLVSNAVLSIDELDQFNEFFHDVYTVCDGQGIPADTAITECGVGQFEINLLHRDDALSAADDAILFKRIIKGMAQKHHLAATFMAKPYPQQTGSGLHIHFSLLNEKGENIFDDGSDQGSKTLLHAVTGLLEAMRPSTLVFAPHLNSYRRLQPHTHAPCAVCWGYENRHAAIRIPGGPHTARRIEHRVAGADANPYLVLAAVLGAALIGIEKQHKPEEPVAGDRFPANARQLPNDWHTAISIFEKSPISSLIFSPLLCNLFVSCKKQEYDTFARQMTDFECTTYLATL